MFKYYLNCLFFLTQNLTTRYDYWYQKTSEQTIFVGFFFLANQSTRRFVTRLLFLIAAA